LIKLSLQIAADGGDRNRNELIDELMKQSFRFSDERSYTFARDVLTEASNNALADFNDRIDEREMSGSTVREVSERLGSKSPNAYAQYEKGKTRTSLDQYERLLMAANPYRQAHLRIV